MFFILEESKSYNFSNLTFEVPKELRTAIKQYLNYFPDYVELSKGKSIQFETRSHKDGVTIEMSNNENIEELNEYFNEYLGFVKTNIDSISPQIETVIDEPQKELFILELKQQVNHLKQQVEFKNFQVKFLEEQVADYHNLLKLERTNPNPILINALSNSHSNSSLDSNIEVMANLRVEIPQLQKAILSTLSNLPENSPKLLQEELKNIDNELMEQGKIESPSDVNQTPLKRIKRLFDHISDENSDLNIIVKGSKKLKDSLQDLGKTYNKIAQWTGMPNIPDLFLNI